jgi:hypothetical protein
MRRMAGLGATAALLLVLVAACGGSDATPSPSAKPSASQPAATKPAPTASKPAASVPVESTPASTSTTMKAICASVGVRMAPTPDGKLVVRLAKGTKVRVVETVTGDSYSAGSCGTSGDAWVKIDRVNNKSIKTAYGVDFGYVAAGFLK